MLSCAMSASSPVYLAATPERATPEQLAEAARAAFAAADLGAVVRGLCAVKSHFGEEGGSGFVPPTAIRAVVDCVREAGGTPFLTDTTTLYTGRRANAVDHALLVHEHGFTIEAVGAPFLSVDGLVGSSETEVAIEGIHHRNVAVAADILRAGSAIVVTHATGHLGTGLGATIKNVGMGLASRRGKLRQHSVMRPEVSEARCSACGECLLNCSTGALALAGAAAGRGERQVARIDRVICSGWGECLTSCRQDAIKYDWRVDSKRLQEETAEHALGFAKRMKGRVGYLTFATTITKDCDCLGKRARPLCPDIGVLAGFDPVALDQAVLDLLRERTGKTLEELAWPKLDAGHQLAHGEHIGLGSRRWHLAG